MKALSDTANGTMSGKEKIMLETYIQMTYFDRIIACEYPADSKAKAIEAVTGLGAKKAVMQKTYEASERFLTKAMRRYRSLIQVLQH